jgi:DNA-binding NtrC family response regulator
MRPLLVLVLDADSERRQQMATLLEGAGHRVSFADDVTLEEPSDLASYDFLVLDPTDRAVNLPALRRAVSIDTTSPPDSLDDMERRHLETVLQHTGGNKRKAAHVLGISRSTLLNKVRKYGLQG